MLCPGMPMAGQPCEDSPGPLRFLLALSLVIMTFFPLCNSLKMEGSC